MNCCDIPAYISSFPQTWQKELTALLCKIIEENTINCETVKSCETLTSISSLSLNNNILSFNYFDEKGNVNNRSVDLSSLSIGQDLQYRNGINLLGNYVELGGTLVKNTDINISSYNFTLSGNNFGLTSFPSSRDDSGIITPINFLYTDNTGYVKSANIDFILDLIPDVEEPEIQFQFNNALTVDIGSSPDLVQWGGSLIKNTVITGNYSVDFNNSQIRIAPDDTILNTNTSSLLIIPNSTGGSPISVLRTNVGNVGGNIFNISNNGNTINFGSNPSDTNYVNHLSWGFSSNAFTETRSVTYLSTGLNPYRVSANGQSRTSNPSTISSSLTSVNSGITLGTNIGGTATTYHHGTTIWGTMGTADYNAFNGPGFTTNVSIETYAISSNSVELKIKSILGNFKESEDFLIDSKHTSLLFEHQYNNPDSPGSNNVFNNIINHKIINATPVVLDETKALRKTTFLNYAPSATGSIPVTGLENEEFVLKSTQGIISMGNSSLQSYFKFPVYATAAQRDRMAKRRYRLSFAVRNGSTPNTGTATWVGGTGTVDYSFTDEQLIMTVDSGTTPVLADIIDVGLWSGTLSQIVPLNEEIQKGTVIFVETDGILGNNTLQLWTGSAWVALN